MMVVNALVRCSAWLLFGKLRLLIGKNKRGNYEDIRKNAV